MARTLDTGCEMRKWMMMVGQDGLADLAAILFGAQTLRRLLGRAIVFGFSFVSAALRGSRTGHASLRRAQGDRMASLGSRAELRRPRLGFSR